jgi:UDP-N-acetylmuramoyl-tripeptide--D-alanyl-D-alanine ligase
VFEFTLAELAHITGGDLHSTHPESTVKGFFVDSRSPIPGGVFVAIKGERVDGHEFLSDVHSNGAGLAIVERSFTGAIPEGLPHLTVFDSIACLGQIAHWARTTKLSAKVIAVTGSSGKTTTKDFIAGILVQLGPTVWAEGSFNTEVGLPLTILRADESTQYLVVEMGMRGLGHIESLTRMAVPDIGVVTNVGSAHIELLGNQENIALAKGELIRSLGPAAWAILNEDDPFVRLMRPSTTAKVASFGESPLADYRAVNVQLTADACSSFTLEFQGQAHRVEMHIPGEHQVSNALAAIAAVNCAGVSMTEACHLIGNIEHISKWRMEVTATDSGVTVINDSYNANPESMRAALKTLVSMSKGRRSIAVLGPMLELGDRTVEEHDSLGRLAVRLDVSLLVCVGDPMKITHLGASQEGSWGEEAHWVPNIDSAITFLSETIKKDDVILVKASRSVGLDRVAEALISGDLSNVSEGHTEGVI